MLELAILKKVADHKVYNIVQLIYHARRHEGLSTDYEFSRLSMDDHWRAGYKDASRALRHPNIFERPNHKETVATFDFSKNSSSRQL